MRCANIAVSPWAQARRSAAGGESDPAPESDPPATDGLLIDSDPASAASMSAHTRRIAEKNTSHASTAYPAPLLDSISSSTAAQCQAMMPRCASAPCL